MSDQLRDLVRRVLLAMADAGCMSTGFVTLVLLLELAIILAILFAPGGGS
jgi:hypothetical protein